MAITETQLLSFYVTIKQLCPGSVELMAIVNALGLPSSPQWQMYVLEGYSF